MEEYPSTVLEFEKRFNSEKACLEYVVKIRWPNGFVPDAAMEKHGLQKEGFTGVSFVICKTSVTAGKTFNDRKNH